MVTNVAPRPENAVPLHQNLFLYSLFCLRISTRPFIFNCINSFFSKYTAYLFLCYTLMAVPIIREHVYTYHGKNIPLVLTSRFL